MIRDALPSIAEQRRTEAVGRAASRRIARSVRTPPRVRKAAATLLRSAADHLEPALALSQDFDPRSR